MLRPQARRAVEQQRGLRTARASLRGEPCPVHVTVRRAARPTASRRGKACCARSGAGASGGHGCLAGARLLHGVAEQPRLLRAVEAPPHAGEHVLVPRRGRQVEQRRPHQPAQRAAAQRVVGRAQVDGGVLRAGRAGGGGGESCSRREAARAARHGRRRRPRGLEPRGRGTTRRAKAPGPLSRMKTQPCTLILVAHT